MPFQDLVESKIQDAMAAGLFDGLKGAGRPLSTNIADDLAGENWMGHKVLQNGGYLPEWLLLAKEIETAQHALKQLDARHAEWTQLAAASQAWERHGAGLRKLRNEYREKANALRKKQDRFNHDAPAIILERPGIWIEHHLRRLEDRLREAGAPDWLLQPDV